MKFQKFEILNLAELISVLFITFNVQYWANQTSIKFFKKSVFMF